MGFQPIVYFLTQASIPTRFAFTGLPSRDFPGRDGCPWVDQATEMQRILDPRPSFIVVEDGIFFHELMPQMKSQLTDALATDYRHVRRYDLHYLHGLFPFERAVMNGGAAADLYEGSRRAEARLSARGHAAPEREPFRLKTPHAVEKAAAAAKLGGRSLLDDPAVHPRR